MRTKTKAPKRIFKETEWRPYFLWWPIRVPLAASTTPEGYHHAYRWAWLETVETRQTTPEDRCAAMDAGREVRFYIYRFLDDETN